MDLATVRREYRTRGLAETDLDPDPFVQFQQWYHDAQDLAAGDSAAAEAIVEPNAAVLATVDADGRPTTRHILVKGMEADGEGAGFDFYTNYESRKGTDLALNPHASLCFVWTHVTRQLTVSGLVEKLSEAESDAYFAIRPRGSQLGAWASEQSQLVASRVALEDRLTEVTARFEGTDVPRPPHWGGYRLVPDEFDFWQGRESRMHDRLAYRRAESGGWRIERYMP